MNRVSKPKEFEEILIMSIDEVFSSLGESVAASLYFHLKKEFKIKKEEIPEQISEFSKALDVIFGPGSKHIELWVMKTLDSKLDFVSEKPWREHRAQKKFSDCVDLMKRSFEKTGKKQEKIGVSVNAVEKQKQYS